MYHHKGKGVASNWFAFWVGGLVATSVFFFAQIQTAPMTTTATPAPQQRYVRPPDTTNSWHAELPLIARHIETPESVRGIYLSAWTAGTAARRAELIQFISESESINAVVIDIKDSTGILSYTGNNPVIRQYSTYSKRIRNLSAITREFHEKGIYVIGRVTAFEDPYLGDRHDEFVLANLEGAPWRNRKGKRQWIDPSNRDYHDYLISVAREAYDQGVDEINLDYVRYPSEGDTTNIQTPDDMTKAHVIEDFFAYMSDALRKESRIPLSADVFGLTTTESTDMGIGQLWENILPHVDYLCPMIYPSHYANGSFGYSNPAEFPYEIITRATQGATKKTAAIGESSAKIRPWIQDFDLGANYGTAEVQDQIHALYEQGVTSWLSWDPSNRYTKPAYTRDILPDTQTEIVKDEH